MIEINGFYVPDPMRVSPEPGQLIYIADITCGSFRLDEWLDGGHQNKLLSFGLIHDNPAAASAHAHALLSFTRRGHD